MISSISIQHHKILFFSTSRLSAFSTHPIKIAIKNELEAHDLPQPISTTQKHAFEQLITLKTSYQTKTTIKTAIETTQQSLNYRKHRPTKMDVLQCELLKGLPLKF